MKWVQEFPTIAVAVIGLFGIVLGSALTFAFNYCSERLKRRWAIIDIKRRYSSQIIRSADELAARIANLKNYLDRKKETSWLRPITDEQLQNIPFDRYYFTSTIFLFGRLIAWIEVLKREQIFLDFASTYETRTFNAYLELIYSAISYSGLTGNEHERSEKNHWIYYHYLSSVGELFFIKESGDAFLRCLTFQEFCLKYRNRSNADFRNWIGEIESLFVELSDDHSDLRWQRLQMVWYCLHNFLQFSDPKKLRTAHDEKRSPPINAGLKAKVKKQAEWHQLEFCKHDFFLWALCKKIFIWS
jgi:hypothetical protein